MKNKILIAAILLITAAVAVGLVVMNKNKDVKDGGTPPPVSSAQCRPTGCSGQVCSDEDIITTCEYREEYACYKTAKCERQTNGACGWTETTELSSCLSDAR